MDTKRALQIAGEEMKKGRNCCQAALLAAKDVWDIPVDENILAATAFMGGGMGAGCVCGALSGIIMASSIRQHYQAHPALKRRALLVTLPDTTRQRYFERR
jgi:C_GCAxxG_C_C family probable redox protein